MKQLRQGFGSMRTHFGGLARLSHDERGASFTEYAVLVGLVAIAGIAGYSVFGEAINSTVESFAATVQSLGGG